MDEVHTSSTRYPCRSYPTHIIYPRTKNKIELVGKQHLNDKGEPEELDALPSKRLEITQRTKSGHESCRASSYAATELSASDADGFSGNDVGIFALRNVIFMSVCLLVVRTDL